ncbi:phosphodiester glycosidase family protein [Streptomyces sp. NPDC050560]|uniref:phosphodiester glycosidase family protein n=1 Tax=Streptomyces sp. NPDC050560 TaxID=3365630 RepID=UPI0037A18A74
MTACAALLGAGLAAATPASAAPSVVSAVGRQRGLAPGVGYRDVSLTASQGRVNGHLVTVDLRNPRVSVDLLHGTSVTDRQPVSALADGQGAVAGVNGDFFNIDETHPGIEPTGSSDGPEIAAGRQLKAAVPDGQRFGPALPVGTGTRDVIGVGVDRRARLDTLTLKGAALTTRGVLPLGGLNQYAVPQNGVGAYTSDWGTVSRARAACGSDTVRADPCTPDAYEVAVRGGRVVSGSARLGSGAIARGTTVLVGRERGADALRRLRPGTPVHLSYRLAARHPVPLRFAVGGFPVLRGGAPLPGLDDATAATRTAAGLGDHGRRLYLFALDGAAEDSAGLTVAELARVMRDFGADDAVNLDGGGSTTLVTRAPGAGHVTVRNHPGGIAERPVPNGIGVFARR